MVTTTDQASNEGSLRYAIDNIEPGGIIKFSPALKGATIKIEGSQLEILKSVTIDALDLFDTKAGIPGITIEGNKKGAVFYINNNTTKTNVKLVGLNITGGFCEIVNQYSLLSVSNCSINNCSTGIYNKQTLFINGCAVYGNGQNDTEGHGIKNEGVINLINCAICNNRCNERDGGGIYNNGQCTITKYSVYNNIADEHGGGICNSDGSLTLTDGRVYGNKAQVGGGISSSGNLVITNSSIYSNQAILHSFGGGIYCDECPSVCVQRSAIYGNSAGSENKSGYGGGIYTKSERFFIANSAVYGNRCTERGAGLYFGGIQFAVVNCTVAGNYAGQSFLNL